MWGSSVAIHLSPHWGLKDPSGAQTSLYVRTYLCFSISLSGHPQQCLAIIFLDWNCAQRMRLQATGSNARCGSTICLSVYLSVHPSIRPAVCPSVCPSRVVTRPFVIFIFVLISSVEVKHYNAFIFPIMVPKDPSGVHSSLYAHLSVALSGCPCRFLAIICAACNHAQCMRPQAKGSKPLER